MQGALGLALDGLGKFVGRNFAQGAINSRQMLEIQCVKFSIIRGAVIRSIPTAPIAAFRREQGLLGVLKLGVGGRILASLCFGVFRAQVGFAGVPEKIPRLYILGVA